MDKSYIIVINYMKNLYLIFLWDMSIILTEYKNVANGELSTLKFYVTWGKHHKLLVLNVFIYKIFILNFIPQVFRTLSNHLKGFRQ